MKLRYAVHRDTLYAEWRVEAQDAHGVRYCVTFRGPDADKRAYAYCQWINSKQEEVKQE